MATVFGLGRTPRERRGNEMTMSSPAYVNWSLLPWDTEQLGLPAARLDLAPVEAEYALARAEVSVALGRTIEECRTAGVRHLTTRAKAADLACIHALHEHQFEFI